MAGGRGNLGGDLALCGVLDDREVVVGSIITSTPNTCSVVDSDVVSTKASHVFNAEFITKALRVGLFGGIGLGFPVSRLDIEYHLRETIYSTCSHQ